jgi:hypothetical protein
MMDDENLKNLVLSFIVLLNLFLKMMFENLINCHKDNNFLIDPF